MSLMFTIIMQILAWVSFIVTTIILGVWLRKNPSMKGAEKSSLILHLLFWFGIAPSIGFGFFYPGLTHFDRELGLKPLSSYASLQLIGMLISLIGLTFILASNLALWILGSGANAFLLTKQLVADGIYRWTRNPMSLGFYMIAIGIGLLVKSTFLTVGALFLFIPLHIFYLKYFEEHELELRLGRSYIEYKQRVPFLLPGITFKPKAGGSNE